MNAPENLPVRKGTVLRSIAFVIVLVNMGLKYAGKSPIDISEYQVLGALEMIASAAVLITSFWKNNSFSEYAKKADFYLAFLKNTAEEE